MTVDQTLREKAIEAVRIRHKDSPGWGCASWSEGQSCCLADEDWWIQVVLDAVDVSALQERIGELEAEVKEREGETHYAKQVADEQWERADDAECTMVKLETEVARLTEQNDGLYASVKMVDNARKAAEARVALAQRVIDAHAEWERRGYKGVPVTFHDLLELWENGPKEVHLN